MFSQCDPGPIGLNSVARVFFINHITINNGDFLFFYQDQQRDRATELWALGRHLVPVSTGIWLVHEGPAVQVRNLFVAGSAADIICFCHFNPNWLQVSGSVAFAALGLLPTSDQIVFLKRRFANAKVHTVFESGIIGRVTDCKIALWQKGKDASFRVIDDLILITYRNRRYKIPVAVFSLNRFETTIGIRSKVRTHKPKGGSGSYREFFLSIQNRR